MADTKISALTAIDAVASGDEFPCNDVSAVASKKSTAAQLLTYLQSVGMPRVFALASDHAISSTTGTEVTGLGPCTLEAGTYQFKFNLILQSATTTVGPMLGINFTGTAAVKTFQMNWADGSTVLTAYTDDMDDEGTKGLGVIAGMNSKTYTTTAPNLGTTVGVTTINADIGAYIEGTIVVTVSGDLELWHSSETATSTTVKAGSTLSVIRCS